MNELVRLWEAWDDACLDEAKGRNRHEACTRGSGCRSCRASWLLEAALVGHADALGLTCTELRQGITAQRRAGLSVREAIEQASTI